MMLQSVTILGAGSMGAGVAAVLHRNGVRVLSPLAKRSPASIRRALEAGVVDATPADMARSDLVMSIVPPSQAEEVARDLWPALADAERKPVFIDCNPIAPKNARRIATMVEATGCIAVDGCIIGLPPGTAALEPRFYFSGPNLVVAASLSQAGLDVHLMEGMPLGAASALKLAYAGITKGLIGLGASMALAADDAGVSEYFRNELARSQPELAACFARTVPDMMGKAKRWVAEMNEISELSGRLIHAELGTLFDDIADSPQRQQRLDGYFAKRG
jgi:putative dehydrogenase